MFLNGFFSIFVCTVYIYMKARQHPLRNWVLFCLHIECMCCTLTLHTFNMVVNKTQFRNGCRLAFTYYHRYPPPLSNLASRPFRILCVFLVLGNAFHDCSSARITSNALPSFGSGVNVLSSVQQLDFQKSP